MSDPQLQPQAAQKAQRVRLPALNDDRRGKIRKDQDNVFYCYQQIIAFEIVRLRGLLDGKYFPFNPAGRQAASYDDFKRDPSLLALDKARKDSLATQALSPGQRVTALEEIIQRINDVSGKLTVVNSPDGPAANGNPHLVAAIGLIQEKILVKLNDAKDNETRDMLVRSFGAGSEKIARTIFGLVIDRLLEHLANTGNTGAGFVFEPDLPAGMGALAKGTGEIIYLSRDALTGQKQLAELAADLIHEGSHTIAEVKQPGFPGGSFGSTFDFVYINCDGHFYLPETLTFINAANYEQVARELLGLRQGPPNAAAADMHELKAPPLTLAHVLLSSRAARAWVRANDLVSQDKADKSENRQIASQGGLKPALPADPELMNAWYAGLFEAAAVIMGSVNKGLSLKSADTPDSGTKVDVLIEDAPNLRKMTITFASRLIKQLSPEDLAMLSLIYILRQKFGEIPEFQPDQGGGLLGQAGRLLKNLTNDSSYASPAKWVYSLIAGIERMDRPGLQKPLAAYYGSEEFKKPQPA
jgi:hypothetical protein